MKALNNYLNCYGFILAICAMIISGFSCSSPIPTRDPLVGFHPAFTFTPDSNKTITNDYKNYIQTLSPEERKSPSVHFFEDGKGQHAVDIIIGLNGRWWRHILIYDRSDKRIMTIKNATGYYAS
jgi:hypothetical protein